ncbi:hypothetical protein D3C72_2231400 [compost metagenome]
MAPFPLAGDQPGIGQHGQIRRKRIGAEIQGSGDIAGVQPLRGMTHQQPEDRQPPFVTKRRK